MKRYISLFLTLVLLLTLLPVAALAAGNNLSASDDIKLYIKSKEGIRLTAYRATPSEEYLTIGYGHYSADITEGMTITEAQADAYFEQDIRTVENAVNRFGDKYGYNLKQNEFDALISLAYNFGSAWIETYNWRICTYLKNGYQNYPELEIADAMAVLCSAGGVIYDGLIKRRLDEANMLLYNEYWVDYDAHFVYVKLDANGGSMSGNRVVVYNKGEPYGKLPEPTRSGYNFAGWKTSDGRIIRNSTIASESLSLTATWSEVPVAKEYKLTVNDGSGSGYYKAGELIQITPTEKANLSFAGWSGDSSLVSVKNGAYYITMPERNASVTATYECVLKDKCPSKSFTDVGIYYWAHNAIDYVVNTGMFNGTSSTTFSPEVAMNRGMIVTVLYRLCGSPDVSAIENPFNDLENNAYHDAILWGYANHIANGYSDDSFRANDTLTREQLATFLLRFAKNIYNYNTEGSSTNLSAKFTDAAYVGAPYREGMSWAVAEGIINGTNETTLSPQKSATRAQVATMLMRFTGGAF